MRLADHILAARGTLFDLPLAKDRQFGVGFATSMGRVIEQAQRFEISDDVARACGELVYSKPSTLLAALPLCRLPYETMWVECRGGLGKYEQPRKDFDNAPTPAKQGVLIESMPGGQVGFMSFAWVHARDYEDIGLANAPNTTPIGVYFDWRPDGDVAQVIRTSHRMILKHAPSRGAYEILEAWMQAAERKWLDTATPEKVSAFMTGLPKWASMCKDAKEVEALMQIDGHMMPGLSPHGIGLATMLMARASVEELRQFVLKWEADMQGEGAWVQCLLAMLNSKNPVVEHQPVDLTKLNKSRKRSGKAPFLSYSKTRLTLSRSQGRIADAHGLSREAARQHLVRGHFKIRRTGVFWWAPFLRGDAKGAAAERKQYEVMQ